MNVRALATAVAVELGEGWSATDGWWGTGDAKLLGPAGAVLHLMVARSRAGRIAVSGVFDRRQHDRIRYEEEGQAGEITVAADSTPEKIASHIQRRLLPEYLALLAVVTQRIAHADAVTAEKAAVVTRLARLLPGGRRRGTEHHVDFDGNGVRGHAVPSYPWPSVRFQVDLSVDDAMALALWLADRSSGINGGAG
jgi:hypothetical protein